MYFDYMQIYFQAALNNYINYQTITFRPNFIVIDHTLIEIQALSKYSNKICPGVWLNGDIIFTKKVKLN